ncbi:MAG: glycosyltransferase family 39 protein, partial [Pyrinomonadaceae bacterium]|nr:glycosyltransferase family 39 protein [Pyrinomonadaceae bacterium]
MNTDEQNINEDQKPKNKDLFWIIGCIVITAIAAFWRFWQLELKPLHHDEGVNAFFLTNLFREGVYKYDPANYHGPDLYYFALAASKMFGLNTISIRGSVAIFGVLTVVLAFFLKDYIGKIGSLAAALFIALSPGMVYISRYFIHEISFVFFSFGIVLGVLYFVEKRKAGVFAIITMTLLLLVCFLPTALNLAAMLGKNNAGFLWALRLGLFAVEAVLVFLIMRMILAWNDGAPIYLLLASASAVLLFATKETAFITIGTMLMAVVSVWLWRKIYRAMIGEPAANELEPVALTWTVFRERLGDSSDVLLIVIA